MPRVSRKLSECARVLASLLKKTQLRKFSRVAPPYKFVITAKGKIDNAAGVKPVDSFFGGFFVSNHSVAAVCDRRVFQ